MNLFKRIAIGLLVSTTVAAPALAADGIEAGLSWRLDFGDHTLAPAFGVSLGLRTDEPAISSVRLFTIDASSTGSFASFAGVPLLTRSYQTSESADSAPVTADSGARPWYARSWVLWTAGGLAATAALAGQGGSGNESHCTGICNQQCAGNTASDCNGHVTVADQEVPTECAPNGTCVACHNTVLGDDSCNGSGFVGESMFSGRSDSSAALDAGTGGMGDLLPVK